MFPSVSSTVTQLEFRQALGCFATGVTVITTDLGDGRVHAMTANAFSSLSLDPPTVMIALDCRSHMHRFLKQRGHFGVSILGQGQIALARYFAGSYQGQLAEQPFEFACDHGYPLVPDAVAFLLCRVVQTHAAGDHTLFIGLVTFTERRKTTETKSPLLFYRSSFVSLEERSEP